MMANLKKIFKKDKGRWCSVTFETHDGKVFHAKVREAIKNKMPYFAIETDKINDGEVGMHYGLCICMINGIKAKVKGLSVSELKDSVTE